MHIHPHTPPSYAVTVSLASCTSSLCVCVLHVLSSQELLRAICASSLPTRWPRSSRRQVADLKEELLERGASRNGVKSTLQRRLHGLIVQDAISNMCAADGDTDEEGASGGEAPAGASSDDMDSEEEAMPLAERLRRL